MRGVKRFFNFKKFDRS